MIALAGLRAHWPRLLATLLAIAAGVGLIGAALLVAESARPGVPARVASASALVVAPQPAQDRSYDAGALLPLAPTQATSYTTRLDAVPGVVGVVADRSFPGQVLPGGRPVGDPDDDAAGHGWSSVALGGHRLVAGTPPRAPGDVVLDRALGIPVGATVPVALGPRREDRRVSGLLDGPGVYVSDLEARTLSPGVGALGVITAPGVDVDSALRGVVAPAQLLTGDERSRAEPAWRARQRFLGEQVIAALVVLTVATTVLVVGATLALAVAGRRRELALLRLVGATPRALRRVVLGEAVGLGVVGGAAGCVPALGLAPPLVRLLVGLGATPSDLVLRVAAWPLPTAAAIGVLVAGLGGWAASRPLTRVRPLEALAAAHVDPVTTSRGRLLAGAATAAVGAACAAATVSTGEDGRAGYGVLCATALVGTAALLAPTVLAPVGRAVIALAPRRSATVLIGAELAGAPRRAASTAAPVVAAVGIAVLFSGLVGAMAVAYPAEQAQGVAGRIVVTGDGTPGLGDDVVTAIGTPPGTRAALPTRVVVAAASGPVAVDAVGTLDTAVGPGQAVLTPQLATALGVAPGDVLPTRFVDGTATLLRVSRVAPLDPVAGYVGLTVDRATVRAHDRSALTEAVFLPPGVSPRDVPDGAVAHDAQEWARADYETDARVSGTLVALVVALAVGYSGIAVANGMAMAARGRRADRGVLATLGATRLRTLGLVAGETTLTVVVGAVLGIAAVVPALAAVGSGLGAATDTDVGVHLDPVVLAGVVSGCLVIAQLAALTTTGLRAPRGS